MTPLDHPSFRRLRRIGAALLVLATLASCSSSLPGDLKVSEITTGRAVGPDGKILADAQTTMFWTTDTFYVAVTTEGSADNVAMLARWKGPDGAVAAESSQTVSPKGPTVTMFEAAPTKQPDGRWPAGDYTLEIVVNGSTQGTRQLNTR
jgi:hypothetical protein